MQNKPEGVTIDVALISCLMTLLFGFVLGKHF